MQFISDFLIVCSIILLLVHINSQLKDSDTENIFNTQYYDNRTLDKKCRLRQPLIISGSIDTNSLKCLTHAAISETKSILNSEPSHHKDAKIVEYIPAKEGIARAKSTNLVHTY